MSRLTRVERCRRLAANARGRDLVVGDLHGHRGLLERQLEAVGFDPSCDRVLSVGDLIDRGPDSLATLKLIEEPWFHAVLGNHELMLLNFLGYYDSKVHSAKSYPTGSGEWVAEAIGKHRKGVLRLAERVAALPLSLHVAAAVPFLVMHGDLRPIGSSRHLLLGEQMICVHKAERTTLSRVNLSEALTSELLQLRFARHDVQISESPLGGMPLTYVGHSPVRHITVHNSYVYVDQGVSMRSPQWTPPTVLEHTAFAHWLRGATTARATSDFPSRFGDPALA
jgi:serine/threonine protein phosphatase 1